MEVNNSENTEINHLFVDYDNEILVINGEEVKEPIVVSLPHECEWSKRKLFNADKYLGEDCRRLLIKWEGE